MTEHDTWREAVETAPKLPAYLDESPPDVNLWRVWCAHCVTWHTHGAGYKRDDPMKFLGHRVAHCWVRHGAYEATGYELVYGGRWANLPPAVRRWGPSGQPRRRSRGRGPSRAAAVTLHQPDLPVPTNGRTARNC